MPIKKPPLINQISIPTMSLPGPSGPPVILWPVSWWQHNPPPSTDLRVFPQEAEYAQRQSGDIILGSVDFRTSLKQASRLWILDRYFTEQLAQDSLKTSLQGSSLREVRINGAKGATQTDLSQYATELQQALLPYSQKLGHVPSVEWRNTLQYRGYLEVHDRFALVDNELWHFGSTVGGCHQSVNAFSRGWNAIDTRAESFYLEVWDR